MNEEKVKLIFSTDEYAYLVGFLNTSYKSMSALPKRLRSTQFDIMEGLVNNQFCAINTKGKTTLK